jgi:FixJ family two-component response regulator
VSYGRANIFIVDDDPAIRSSLDGLLRAEDFTVATFESATEFLAHTIPDEPGCLLLDLRFPKMNGLALQQRLIEKNVHLPIIFITAHGEIPDSVRAVKAGAVDFLTKPFTHERLVQAIDQALEVDRLARQQRTQLADLRGSYNELTSRQQQVLQLVVTGRLNKQIAGELGISEITVKLHRGRVMKKMRAGLIAELVKMSEKLGIPGPVSTEGAVPADAVRKTPVHPGRQRSSKAS